MCRADISDVIELTIDEAGLADEAFFIDGIAVECRTVESLTTTRDGDSEPDPCVLLREPGGSMSGVPYHAWTHRPKEQGGTDPDRDSGRQRPRPLAIADRPTRLTITASSSGSRNSLHRRSDDDLDCRATSRRAASSLPDRHATRSSSSGRGLVGVYRSRLDVTGTSRINNPMAFIVCDTFGCRRRHLVQAHLRSSATSAETVDDGDLEFTRTCTPSAHGPCSSRSRDQTDAI